MEQSVWIFHIQAFIGNNRIANMEGQAGFKSDFRRLFVEVVFLVPKRLEKSLFEINCITGPIRYQKR